MYSKFIAYVKQLALASNSWKLFLSESKYLGLYV